MMRDWTDEQFRDAGWNYVLRFEGAAIACTVSPFDAANWQNENLGEVTILRQKKVTKQTYDTEESTGEQ